MMNRIQHNSFKIYLISRQNLNPDLKRIKIIRFASTAGRQRTCVRAPPASFEKFAAHFPNPAFGGAEPAEALPQVLVKIAVSLIRLSFQCLQNALHLQ